LLDWLERNHSGGRREPISAIVWDLRRCSSDDLFRVDGRSATRPAVRAGLLALPDNRPHGVLADRLLDQRRHPATDIGPARGVVPVGELDCRTATSDADVLHDES